MTMMVMMRTWAAMQVMVAVGVAVARMRLAQVMTRMKEKGMMQKGVTTTITMTTMEATLMGPAVCLCVPRLLLASPDTKTLTLLLPPAPPNR